VRRVKFDTNSKFVTRHVSPLPATLKQLKLLDAAMMCVCAPRVLAASNSFSRPGQWLTALAVASHK